MNHYGKIHASLYEGSMVGKGAIIFAVWGYVIANQFRSDSTEYPMQVTLNEKILSTIFGEPVEDIREAIAFLCRPDPDSRSKSADGRRLVPIEQFRFWVVNGVKYQSAESRERRKEQLRKAQSEYRRRNAK